MTSKVIEGNKRSPNFSVNPTLPKTLIYQSILMKNYANANIINTYANISFEYASLQIPFTVVWISLFLSLSPKVPLLLHFMQIYGRFRPYFLT